MRKIKVNEYEVIEDLRNGTFKALRHGEEWKDLIGDNFVLALIDEIDRLRVRVYTAEDILHDAQDLLDNVHAYDTDVFRAISRYLHGDDE